MEVPGYTEIRELGHGGTGRVMLAVRDSDGLAVAIKHLSEPLRADAEFVERFRAEAEVIREIDSPHTARLLEYVEGQDDAVIVMELVDGVTLRRLLEHEGATGPEAALVVLKGALLGLAEAHRRGVVHRDFKPENVIITQDGESKLVDFGVAAHFGETAALVGTPSYMAPEQWDDAPAGPATDVYAATLVFFECLTGHRAFQGENVAALAYQHQHILPQLGEVEEPLRPLLEHGLAKDPAGRPSSAEEFLAELEEVALAEYGAEWERRGRAGLGIALLPLAALLPKPQPVAESTTSVVQSTLAPAAKFAVTGGLVLATAAAVVSAFVILGDSPEPGPGTGLALPPATSAAPQPSRTPAPASPTSAPPTSAEPTPSGSIPGTPPVTYAGQPTAPPTAPPGSPPPATTREPTGRPTTTEPTRQPTRSGRPSERPTERPTTRPTTRPPTGEPSATRPPATRPPDTEPPATRPPATSAPDPGTPTRNREPLISVSVKVSVNLPILGGDGDDGLLDADIDLGLGSSLLGMVVVPGSVLVGRQIVVRRVRRPRDTEKL
ncbi:protein kinase domain-containing protein [Nonomuraea jabiensis]|uniref:serine/threonine-protein kinase n=1 Tax=Nonomuraea jabiensis TaxID=882448 RepID=UPI003D720ED3